MQCLLSLAFVFHGFVTMLSKECHEKKNDQEKLTIWNFVARSNFSSTWITCSSTYTSKRSCSFRCACASPAHHSRRPFVLPKYRASPNADGPNYRRPVIQVSPHQPVIWSLTDALWLRALTPMVWGPLLLAVVPKYRRP